MARMRIGAQTPKQKREYHSIYNPTKGLYYDSSLPSTLIGEEFSPDCEEVILDKGIIAKESGASAFGTSVTTPLNGQIMLIDQYYKTNSDEKLVCLTTSDAYYYDTATTNFFNITQGFLLEDCEDAWDELVDGDVTATADATIFYRGTKSCKLVVGDGCAAGDILATESIASTDITTTTHIHLMLCSTVDLAAGDIQILLDDTGSCASPIESLDIPAITAGVWTMCSLELATPASCGAIISVGCKMIVDKGAFTLYLDDIRAVLKYTGDEDNFFTTEIMNNLHISTNYIDQIKKWDMATNGFLPLGGVSALRCKKLVVYGERLNLYHVEDTGTAYPQQVNWSVAGDPENHTGTGSGSANLIGVFGVDFIQTAEKIGSYVAIYGERSIALQEYRGTSATNPYSFTTRVVGVGLAAPQALVNLDEEHIFLGWDNIYSYKGGKDVEPIGDKIKEELFDIIDPAYIHRSFMVFIEEKSIIRLYVPTIGNTTPNIYFSFNIKTNGWSRGTRSYTGYGYYSQQNSLTWDTITGTWDEQTGRWDDRTRLALAPINLFGNSQGEIYQVDDSVYTVADSNINSWWATKDFIVGDRYRQETTNWMGVSFEARGTSITVEVSTNFGAIYDVIRTITLTESWAPYRVDFERWSSACRVRFHENGSGWWQVRQIEMGYVKGSDR